MTNCAKCGQACGNDCLMSPAWIRQNERERITELLVKECEAELTSNGVDPTRTMIRLDVALSLINGKSKPQEDSDCGEDCCQRIPEDEPCSSCGEACLSCQDKFDEETPEGKLLAEFRRGKESGSNIERHKTRLVIEKQMKVWEELGYTDAVSACIDILNTLDGEKSED